MPFLTFKWGITVEDRPHSHINKKEGRFNELHLEEGSPAVS